jgi:hypothetical protein
LRQFNQYVTKHLFCTKNEAKCAIPLAFDSSCAVKWGLLRLKSEVEMHGGNTLGYDSAVCLGTTGIGVGAIGGVAAAPSLGSA